MSYGFKPGQSGNPGGRPKLPAELRAARKRDMASLIRMIAHHFGMTMKEAKEKSKQPEISCLESAVLGLIMKSIKGDSASFRYLIELMCGKVPDNDFDEFTEDELALLEQIKATMAKRLEDEATSSH